MFKVGDKVVYYTHPEAKYFNEYRGKNIEGCVFEVQKVAWDGHHVEIIRDGDEYSQNVDPLNLTILVEKV